MAGATTTCPSQLQARGQSRASSPPRRDTWPSPLPPPNRPDAPPLTLERTGAAGQPHGDAAAERAGPPAAPPPPSAGRPPPRSLPRKTAGPRWRRSSGRGAAAAEAEGTDKADAPPLRYL